MSRETFEQGDEALDEEHRINPQFIEELEQDPSLDPTLIVDSRELEEVAADLDDPEALVVLEGGIDDPDGLGGPPPSVARSHAEDEQGWVLDAPLVRNDEPDLDVTD